MKLVEHAARLIEKISNWYRLDIFSGYDCRSFWNMVRDNREQVVDLIYTKQLAS